LSELERRAAGWWIAGIPDCEDAGPYDTKAEANEDRLGLENFYRRLEKAKK